MYSKSYVKHTKVRLLRVLHILVYHRATFPGKNLNPNQTFIMIKPSSLFLAGLLYASLIVIVVAQSLRSTASQLRASKLALISSIKSAQLDFIIYLLIFCGFKTGFLLCSPGCPGNLSLQTRLVLTSKVCLPLPLPKCWDQGCVPPCPPL